MAIATMPPGCGSTGSLIEFEVSAPMEGSPNMGEGERSRRKLRRTYGLSLVQDRPLTMRRFEVDERGWVGLGGRV